MYLAFSISPTWLAWRGAGPAKRANPHTLAIGGQFASGGFAVNGIASTPYNVAVGGTQFDDTGNPDAYWSPTTDPTTGLSVLSYIPETVWNESSNDPNSVLLYAGSGGVSAWAGRRRRSCRMGRVVRAVSGVGRVRPGWTGSGCEPACD